MTGNDTSPQAIELALRAQALDVANAGPHQKTEYVGGLKACPACRRPIASAACQSGVTDFCQCRRG